MRLLVATILSLVSLTSCQQPAAPEPAGLTEADRAAIEATSQAFLKAALARDWQALAMLYTEDAVLMPPNAEPIRGRSAIQQHFSSFPPVTDMQLQDAEIDGRGDLAYVAGGFRMTITPEGADPIEESGKFIEIRKKQVDGSWLIYRDMYSSNTTAAPPQPEP